MAKLCAVGESLYHCERYLHNMASSGVDNAGLDDLYNHKEIIPTGLPPIVRVECLQKTSDHSSCSSEELVKRVQRKKTGVPLPTTRTHYRSCPDLAENNAQDETRKSSAGGSWKTSPDSTELPTNLTKHKIPLSAYSSPRSSPLMRRKRNGNMYGTISSLANNPAKSRMDVRELPELGSLPNSPSSTPLLRRKLISPVLKIEAELGTLVPLSGRTYTVENVSLKHGGLLVTERPGTHSTNRNQGKSHTEKQRYLTRVDSKESLETRLKELENNKAKTCDCIGECEHVPDGMTPESFDRCRVWLQTVEKAKVEPSGLELYTAPPLNWNSH